MISKLSMAQLWLVLPRLGWLLAVRGVLKCTIYCISVDLFPAVNEVYARYFLVDAPARVFVNVPAWPSHFDIEIDCIATT